MPRLTGPDNPAWRGGHAGYRGPSWATQRRLCLERDGSLCRECGSDSDVTVHHVRPFRLFASHVEANELVNLLTLCRTCHTEADNAFWVANAHLLESVRSQFPDCRLIRTCERCGEPFEATARATVCLPCCTYRCEVCGESFVSRKRRTVRFCSRECNVEFRKREAKWPHACEVCGVRIGGARFRCRACHLRDPAGSVRPGRRLGRPPKDPPAA